MTENIYIKPDADLETPIVPETTAFCLIEIPANLYLYLIEVYIQRYLS